MLLSATMSRAALYATVVLLFAAAIGGSVAAVGGPAVIPTATQPAENLKAILPSGAEIELVALSRSPDKGQPWWRPDGTRLGNPPFDPNEWDFTSENDLKFKKVELVFRLGKKAAEPGYEAQIWSTDGTGMWWAGRRTRGSMLVADLKVVGVNVPADAKTFNLDLKVAAGPWKELTSDGLQPRGALSAARATEGNDPATVITARCADDEDVQMIAVEKDGTTHISRGATSLNSGHIREIDFLFAHVAPARFKSFTLQTRPYELIRLQDIATAPGSHTDAQLTAAPAPATQPATK